MSAEATQYGYDIFRNLHNEAPLWVASVATLAEVELTLNALAWVEPGDYFTQDCATGEIVSGRNPCPNVVANREAALLAA
jgi:hypothetical protein